MKKLFLIRHADAIKKTTKLSDINRPLSAKGKRAAKELGIQLKESALLPDVYYSSPADRAIKTAKIIAKTLNFNCKKIIINNNMYAATVKDLIKLVNKIDNAYSSAVLFGHCPEFLVLLNYFTALNIEDFPKCAVFCIKFKVNFWEKVSKNSGVVSYCNLPQLFHEVLK